MQLKFGILILLWAPLALSQSWQIKQLNQRIEGGQTVIEINQAQWDQLTFNNIELHCSERISLYPEHTCEQGQLTFDFMDQQWNWAVNHELNWMLEQWSVEASLWSETLSFALKDDSNQLSVQLNQLPLTRLTQLLPYPWLETLTSTFSGDATFDWEKRHLNTSGLTWSALNAAWGDDMILAELSGALDADIDAKNIQFNWQTQVNQGEALLGPVYLNFKQWPLTMTGSMALNGAAGWVLVIEVYDQDSFQLKVDAEITESGDVENIVFDLNVEDAAQINQQVLSSVLDLYGFKNSILSGAWRLKGRWQDSLFEDVSWHFKDFVFENTLRKLQIENLNGTVFWQQKTSSPNSQLSWSNLLLAGMPVGASQAQFNITSDLWRLVKPHQWPVFDGSIEIKEWEVSQLFSPEVDMRVSARINPISLALITEKMGWPKMSGTLSGTVPAVVKKGPMMVLEGGLDLQVFEGNMRVKQMSTERLFGVAPVIAADVSIEGFNLAQLTETFGFGKITGLLSGNVNNLRITNWKADRLDAEIQTTKKKGIKQTISQQAIDHISSLGGIQGAISRSFLRFFDSFRYQQIKLSCRLHNSVCQIGGLNNTSKQFTIVEGGGIPKINIVGYVREIDWDTFISRLLNANYEG